MSPASPAQPSQPSLRTQFIVQKLNAGGIFFLQLCAAEQKGNKLKGSGKLFEWKFNNFLQLLAATSLLPVEARLPRRGNMLRYTLWVERPQCTILHYALVTALWVLSPLRVTHRQRGHWRRHCSFLQPQRTCLIVPGILLVPELVLVLAMMTGRPSCQLTLSASHLGSAINPPPDINLFQLFTGWQNKHGIPVMEVV